MNCVFISSTGRTGTDFFTHLFNNVVKNSWSQHEPRPAFRRRSYRFVDHPYTAVDKLYFRLSRQWMNYGHNEKWYVETNYHLFSAIPMLREAFPGCLTAHIIRDGRAVVRSWLNRGRYIVDDHITPFHLKNDPAQAQWKKWNAVQKLAWYWKTINRTAERMEPDLLLRFENIFRQEESDIYRILERMDGIEYTDADISTTLGRRVNQSVNPFIPRFEEWPAEWQEQFWDVAGDEMERLGYS